MSIEDVNATIKRWRANVKNKFRGIASFGERAQMRFDQVKARIYPKRVTFDNWLYRQGVYHGPGNYTFKDRQWKTIKIGQTWGGEDTTAFFRKKITVPREFAGQPVALQIFLGGDSLVSVNGKPFHGLDIFRNELLLSPKARAGEVFDIEIESYMNFQGTSPKTNEFLCSDLVTVDKDVSDAYWDLWCVAKLLEIPELDAKLRDFVEANLWEAMKGIPLQVTDEAAFRQTVLKARRMVRSTVYATDRFKGSGMMYLVGHSHLDVVFMWPYREFIRKVGRTHATMLRLMEQYPEFRFSQSQAKIYADMKQYYPALFEQVKRRVKEGRWEALGAFWVEPDCNLISGESLVRQIIHGQRFFRENFGRVSRTCWQPDVFGLSWVFPQVLARSGVKYFISNKFVPWSDTNPWTMNNFWWEGFDGSRVLAVVPPGHFIGTVDADVIDKQWRNFNDKEKIGKTFHIFGWGDGGGGVDPEMLESARRYRDMPGLVRMRYSSVEEGIDAIAAEAAKQDLPVLRDEIYLEAHRGTYTHRGMLKKLNRRAELLYREAELLATMAWARTGRYPAARFDEGWKILLENQFHDALPGTHIPKVYPELLEAYRRAKKTGEDVRREALETVAGRGDGAPDSLLLFNSMFFSRGGCTSVPESAVKGMHVADPQGRPLLQQTVTDLEGGRRRLFIAPETPSVGFKVVGLSKGRKGGPRDSSLRVSANSLENEFIRAVFNRDGELTSVYDKEQKREMLPRGKRGNVFQMYEDTPGRYDAWDIVETYIDHPIDIAGNAAISVDETGPLRVSLRIEKRIGKSRLAQRVSLCSGSRDLHFETEIDWVERQRLLKVAFPVAVNANMATFDIAYGNMTRPTFANNSRDRARFELPAHQWMDISQADCGMSVLNDCKYGCDVREDTLRLTLLKGSIHPDPKADVGTHHFTYALRPHAGDWRQGGTIEAAMSLNHPILVTPVRSDRLKVSDGHGLLSCTAPNLTLEALKRSEDGKHVIVRVVDRHNVSTTGEMVFDRPVRRAWSCNLMEEKEKALAARKNRVRFTARPYEIVTLRVELAQ